MPDDDYDDLEADAEGDSSVIRSLRAELRKAKADAKEVSELRQRLVISDTKLDLTPKQQKALLAAHEGEMDAEALRQTAIDLGFAKAPEPTKEEPQVPDEEREALQRVQDATGAAQPADGSPESLEDRMRKAIESGGEKALDALLANEGIGVNAEQ